MKNDNKILKFIIQNIISVASVIVFIALFIPRSFDPIAKLTHYDGHCEALLATIFKESSLIGFICAAFGLRCLIYFIQTFFINILGWYSLIIGAGIPNGCFCDFRLSTRNIHLSDDPANSNRGRLAWEEKNRIREALREVDLYQYSNEHRWLKKDKK